MGGSRPWPFSGARETEMLKRDKDVQERGRDVQERERERERETHTHTHTHALNQKNAQAGEHGFLTHTPRNPPPYIRMAGFGVAKHLFTSHAYALRMQWESV
jgi:hypothetical protein